MNDERIITWSDYKRDDGELTFGLLSQVSPDGRYVISTVKDRAVFVATPGIEFSQLFFPIKGILVVYDTETRTYAPLPGADDPEYVQSNPTWSPDGKSIVFARAKAYREDEIANATSDPARREGRPRVRRGQEAVQVRPVPGSVQRRPRRQGRADRGRLARREEQLLREVLAGREVDRLLQGRELHAADAGQRALHRPGRRRRGAAPAREHAPHELLAQLLVQRPLARLLLEGEHALHPALPDPHRRGRRVHAPGRARALHREPTAPRTFRSSSRCPPTRSRRSRSGSSTPTRSCARASPTSAPATTPVPSGSTGGASPSRPRTWSS